MSLELKILSDHGPWSIAHESGKARASTMQFLLLNSFIQLILILALFVVFPSELTHEHFAWLRLAPPSGEFVKTLVVGSRAHSLPKPFSYGVLVYGIK